MNFVSSPSILQCVKFWRPPRLYISRRPCASLHAGDPRLRVAVVGGGLSGLSVAYHLLHSDAGAEVCVFDRNPQVGQGNASAAAAGLMHPYSRTLGRKVWKGQEAYEEGLRLLKVVESLGLGVMKKTGLLRIISDDRDQIIRNIKQWSDDVELWDVEKVRNETGLEREAVWVKDAVLVNTSLYMKGLWEICKQTGRAQWIRANVTNLEHLYDAGYHSVVCTAGPEARKFSSLKRLRVKGVRGQNVFYSSKRTKPAAKISRIPLIAGKYVLPVHGNDTEMMAGATFEYEEETMNGPADLEKANSLLREPLERCLVPALDSTWRPQRATVGLFVSLSLKKLHHQFNESTAHSIFRYHSVSGWCACYRSTNYGWSYSHCRIDQRRSLEKIMVLDSLGVARFASSWAHGQECCSCHPCGRPISHIQRRSSVRNSERAK